MIEVKNTFVHFFDDYVAVAYLTEYSRAIISNCSLSVL